MRNVQKRRQAHTYITLYLFAFTGKSLIWISCLQTGDVCFETKIDFKWTALRCRGFGETETRADYQNLFIFLLRMLPFIYSATSFLLLSAAGHFHFLILRRTFMAGILTGGPWRQNTFDCHGLCMNFCFYYRFLLTILGAHSYYLIGLHYVLIRCLGSRAGASDYVLWVGPGRHWKFLLQSEFVHSC